MYDLIRSFLIDGVESCRLDRPGYFSREKTSMTLENIRVGAPSIVSAIDVGWQTQ